MTALHIENVVQRVFLVVITFIFCVNNPDTELEYKSAGFPH